MRQQKIIHRKSEYMYILCRLGILLFTSYNNSNKTPLYFELNGKFNFK